MKKKKAIVIGAGFGGLATAAILGKAGYAVTILEKNKTIGGRAMQYKEKGFTFDMGPSWYLMPEVFERYFSLFGKKPQDYFRLKRLDPNYRIFYGKDDYLDMSADVKTNLKLFESMEKDAGQQIKKYLDRSKILYNNSINAFLYNNYTSFRQFINPTFFKAGREMPVFTSLDTYIGKFTKNEKIKKILAYTIVFLGGSPKNTPAIYSLMSHVDFHLGVYYPIDGMFAVVRAIESICHQYKVTIKTNEPVTNIVTDGNIVTGIKTKKARYDADIVVSNADYPHTELDLLDDTSRSYPSSYWKKKTFAPSTFLLYLGIKGKVKNLKHHNLFFANDWEKHFDEIFTKPTWPEKPSYYLCCPSLTDTSVAPKGDTNLFLLIPIASGLKDTKQIREAYAKKMISHLEEVIGEKITNRILVKKTLSIADYKELYNAYNGTALGLSHTLLQTALGRPANKSKKLRNLYYVGQYTQPGIGVPMCLISAELVAQRIQSENTQ
jgi:1-hydroxy-2-isopentenylcarotenoid 3,4-desaturase